MNCVSLSRSAVSEQQTEQPERPEEGCALQGHEIQLPRVGHRDARSGRGGDRREDEGGHLETGGLNGSF